MSKNVFNTVAVTSTSVLEEDNSKLRKKLRTLRAELRQAIADYMYSEGCSCCEDTEAHKEHEARIAKLLSVPKYDDASGYDFSKYRSKD